MQVRVLLLALGSVVCGRESLSPLTETLIMSKAIVDVIKKSFLEDITIINIITSVDQDEKISSLMEEIVNEVSMNISKEAVNLRISDIDNVFVVREKRFYNILLVANFESFEKFQRVEELFDFQGYFLVVLVEKYENQYDDMKKIFHSMWQHSIVNANALTVASADGSLDMFTFYPYTADHCGRAVPTLENKFVNSSFIMSRKHYRDKLMNLFGCSLKVVTFNIAPLMFVAGGNSTSVEGIEGELLIGKQDNELWQTFEFTL
jgi:hypothetical protein